MPHFIANIGFEAPGHPALFTAHCLNDSARLGWAMRRAVEDRYDGTVAIGYRAFPRL